MWRNNVPVGTQGQAGREEGIGLWGNLGGRVVGQSRQQLAESRKRVRARGPEVGDRACGAASRGQVLNRPRRGWRGGAADGDVHGSSRLLNCNRGVLDSQRWRVKRARRPQGKANNNPSRQGGVVRGRSACSLQINSPALPHRQDGVFPREQVEPHGAQPRIWVRGVDLRGNGQGRFAGQGRSDRPQPVCGDVWGLLRREVALAAYVAVARPQAKSQVGGGETHCCRQQGDVVSLWEPLVPRDR